MIDVDIKIPAYATRDLPAILENENRMNGLTFDVNDI